MAQEPSTPHQQDWLMGVLHALIRFAVRVLAVLMTVVILFGVVDVVWVVYHRLIEPPLFILEISDILATFGTFMAVLIAIEIFANIVLYLRHDVIHVKLVMATAVMAVARKVIILDFDTLKADQVVGLAAAMLATSIAYLIIYRFTPAADRDETQHL